MSEGLFPPVPLTKASELFVKRCVDILISLSVVYGFDRSNFSVRSTYNHWIYCSAVSGSPMKFLKYKLATFYVSGKMKMYDEVYELPPSPSNSFDITLLDHPLCLFGGKGYRWLEILMNKGGPTFDSFLTSVLYSKKGMPRPSREDLRISKTAAFKLLTEHPEVPSMPENLLPWADISDGKKDVLYSETLSQETLIKQIKRTVDEIYGGKHFSLDDKLEPFFPSTSANYIKHRSGGGAVGLILEDPSLLDGLRTDVPLINISSSLIEDRKGNKLPSVNYDGLKDQFDALYQRILIKAREELPLTELVALAEALKVRIITKGPGLLYTALKPLQSFLWKTLKNLKTFKFIGTPINEKLLQDCLGAKLSPNQFFLSVDYTDATNRIYKYVTDATCQAISDTLKLSDIERELFQKSLTGHYIIDPDDLRESPRFSPQLRGQLMGSITSFPILCIINATVLRWCYELDKKRSFRLHDVPMTVNGDDAVIKLSCLGQLFWERIGNFCGLEPSVGKVYFSKHFLNMNSMVYNYSTSGWYSYQVQLPDRVAERTQHFQEVKYINLGLLYGLKRSGVQGREQFSHADNTIDDSFSSRCAKLIDMAPQDLQERVMCQFLHINRDVLSKYRIPWFIPKRFCGLELPTVGSYAPLDLDLRRARKIFDHPDIFPVPSMPLNMSWRVWDIVQRQYPIVPFNVSESFGEISYDRLWGLAAVECLFREPFSSLFAGEENMGYRNSNRYFRTCERIWSNALYKSDMQDKFNIPLPEPFKTFPSEFKITSIPHFLYLTNYAEINAPSNSITSRSGFFLSQKKVKPVRSANPFVGN